jgi:hypothetical protein
MILSGILALLVVSNVWAQNEKRQRIHSHRNILWFTPAQTPIINGLAIGFAAVAIGPDHQQINGVNVEATFLYLYPVMPVIDVIATICLPVNRWRHGRLRSEQANRFFYWSDSVAEEINGVNISLGSWLAEQRVNGLTVSLMTNSYVQHKGVCISATSNWLGIFYGVTIAPFGNVSRKGRGVQVGLVNSCGNCSGLQLGLLNQNGGRITPLIGYRSRRKAVAAEMNKLVIPPQTRHLDFQRFFFTRAEH